MKSKKPVIGIFSFTCCEGCQLELLQLDKAFLSLLGIVHLSDSRTLLEQNENLPLDLAIVEGSIVSKEEAEKLKAIRERSGFLIALGSCACTGGIPAMRNILPDEVKAPISEQMRKINSEKVSGIGEIVKVDYFLHGCPIVKEEFAAVVKKLLSGQKPREIDYPVCFECKANETTCFLLKGVSCLGPVSNAGCNAVCTSHGLHCTACRGINKDSNLKALKKCFLERNIPEKEFAELLNIYNAGAWKDA